MIGQKPNWAMNSEQLAEPLENGPSALNGTDSQPINWRFSTRGVALRLFITCWLIYGLHFATNIVREIYPAVTLGDHLSFDVSEYKDLHPDIFEVPGRGAYINNNPGASIIGAVPYLLARPVIDRVVERVQRNRASVAEVESAEYKTIYPMAQEFYRKTRARGLDVKLGLAALVIQAFAMAPLSAVSVVVMFYLLVSLTSCTRKAILLSLLYAFATPVLFRTAQLNQNLLVSHFALFAFAVLWKPWDSPFLEKKIRYLLAGLLCGWTVVLDYSGLVVVVFISVYGWLRRSSLPTSSKSPRDLLQFATGLTICALVLMGYQGMAFGNPLFPAQRYMPATQYSGSGYHGIALPQLDLLWDSAFGIRFGLFISAPLLLLALYIPGWFNRRYRLLNAPELWSILTFTLAFFLFCAANQFGRLQFNSGVRYLVPVVPFLFFIASGVLLRMPRLLAVLFGIGATYWSWCLAMYRDVEQGLGIFESLVHITFEGLRLPWLTTLERMGYFPNGVSVFPLLLLSAVFIWALWSIKFQERPLVANTLAASTVGQSVGD